MPRPIECPRVMVEWRDAVADTGWGGCDGLEAPAPLIVSVGWMVVRSNDAVVLAADVAAAEGDPEVNRRIKIPMGMVERILSNDGRRVLYRSKRRPSE